MVLLYHLQFDFTLILIWSTQLPWEGGWRGCPVTQETNFHFRWEHSLCAKVRTGAVENHESKIPLYILSLSTKSDTHWVFKNRLLNHLPRGSHLTWVAQPSAGMLTPKDFWMSACSVGLRWPHYCFLPGKGQSPAHRFHHSRCAVAGIKQRQVISEPRKYFSLSYSQSSFDSSSHSAQKGFLVGYFRKLNTQNQYFIFLENN